MIKLNFFYKERKIEIYSNINDTIRDICIKFANKINDDVDSKIYIYNKINLNINLEQKLTFAEIINSDDKDIQVFDNNNIIIKYTYKGENKEIKVNEGDKYESILERIGKTIRRRKSNIFSLYNGKAIVNDDLNQSIDQISKKEDKSGKRIHLLIEDYEENNENENKEENKEKKEEKEIKEVDEEEEKEKEDKEDKKDEEKDEEKIYNNKEEKDEKSISRVSIKESVNEKEDNEESDSEYLIYRNSKEAGKFISKIHRIVFFQFLTIGILVCIGFYYNIEIIFIDSLISMLGAFIPTTIFAFVLTGFTIFSKNNGNLCFCFNIFIYIPIITIYLYLLSKFIRKDYIVIVLFLFIIDFLIIITFILIFKKYKGYGILIFTLIINFFSIFIYYKVSDSEKIQIIIISIIAFSWINYILIFNNIVRQNTKDKEYIYAVSLFNYCIFVPVLTIFAVALLISLVALLISLIAAILGIFLALLIIMLAFLLIFLLFNSLK